MDYQPEYRFAYRPVDYNHGKIGFFVNAENLDSLFDNPAYKRHSPSVDFQAKIDALKFAQSVGFLVLWESGYYANMYIQNPYCMGYAERLHGRIQAFMGKLNLDYRQEGLLDEVLSALEPGESETNPDLWAYYQNLQKKALKGKDGKGVKTQIKYGALLKKLFPMATDDQISAEVESWKEAKAFESAPLEYHIATDADSFEYAYSGDQAPTLNPSLSWPFKSLAYSCMRHKGQEFSGTNGAHPARAYASGDFAIVYATKGGKIAARATVPYNKAHKTDSTKPQLTGISGPIYTATNAASAALQAFIEANGAEVTSDDYKAAKHWANGGYRMAKIDLGNGRYLMPYVDLCGYAEDTEDSFVLSERGDIETRPTCGYTNWNDKSAICDRCNERYDEDELTYQEDSGECYCEECHSELYVYSSLESEYIRRDDSVKLYRKGWRGQTYYDEVSQHYADINGILCYDDEEYWLVEYVMKIEGEYYSPNFDAYGVSDWDGETYLVENLVTLSNGQTVSLAEVESEEAWVCVNGQWQLHEHWQYEDSDKTSWFKVQLPIVWAAE